jgi:hypothetical protein
MLVYSGNNITYKKVLCGEVCCVQIVHLRQKQQQQHRNNVNAAFAKEWMAIKKKKIVGAKG